MIPASYVVLVVILKFKEGLRLHEAGRHNLVGNMSDWRSRDHKAKSQHGHITLWNIGLNIFYFPNIT